MWRLEAVSRVRTKMMVWPSFSHTGKIISFSTSVLSLLVGHTCMQQRWPAPYVRGDPAAPGQAAYRGAPSPAQVLRRTPHCRTPHPASWPTPHTSCCHLRPKSVAGSAQHRGGGVAHHFVLPDDIQGQLLLGDEHPVGMGHRLFRKSLDLRASGAQVRSCRGGRPPLSPTLLSILARTGARAQHVRRQCSR